MERYCPEWVDWSNIYPDGFPKDIKNLINPYLKNEPICNLIKRLINRLDEDSASDSSSLNDDTYKYLFDSILHLFHEIFSKNLVNKFIFYINTGFDRNLVYNDISDFIDDMITIYLEIHGFSNDDLNYILTEDQYNRGTPLNNLIADYMFEHLSNNNTILDFLHSKKLNINSLKLAFDLIDE